MVICQLKDEKFNGNCTSCNERSYCMMTEIMQKLQDLENTVTQLKAKAS
jgi:hypothetical protein